MPSPEEELQELEREIAIVRENLRTLTEQAAALSGGADEARASDRIAEQDELLASLTARRDALEDRIRGGKRGG
jgi:hypothetical protein